MQRFKHVQAIALAVVISLGLSGCATMGAGGRSNASPVVVFFAADSSVLTESAKQVLEQAVSAAKAAPRARLFIQGFADNIPDAAERRRTVQAYEAQVRAQLVARGLADGRITEGAPPTRGGSKGVAAFQSDPALRRVEITVR
jgi:outer membrane protein OmpA-like peptidoglycan-associated protein